MHSTYRRYWSRTGHRSKRRRGFNYSFRRDDDTLKPGRHHFRCVPRSSPSERFARLLLALGANRYKTCSIGHNVLPLNATRKRSAASGFSGTRVPVRALFENLESGARIDDFLDWFPGVTRDQVETVLRHAERSLTVA